MRTKIFRAFMVQALLASSLLVAGLIPVQNAAATTLIATTSDDGFPAHQVTWLDSSGNTRTAMMIDQNSTGGGPYTGYLRQYSYYVGATLRICTGFYSAADGDHDLYEFSGDGFVQNHTAQPNDFSTGNYPGTPGTTTVTNLGSHVIIQYDIPTYKIDGPYYSPSAKTVPTTIQWFFADGRDHPIFAVSQDASGTGGNLGADSRTPYGDMAYDGYETYYGFTDGGCGTDGNLNNVGGASYGDIYKFVTTPDTGFLTLNSAWVDTAANTIPYAMQWAQDDTYTPTEGNSVPGVDAEWGHVATLPGSVYDQGEDPTADPGSDPRDSSGASMIPDQSWAYQIMAYLWPSENGGSISDPTQEKKVTWGRNFGSVGGYDGGVGGGNVDPLNYYPHWNDPLGENYSSPTRLDGSLMAYSVFDVFGVHNGNYLTGAVGTQVTQMENVASATLSVSTGTKAISGPAGVGNTAYAQSKTITYSPAGYNPTYSVWEITASGNQVNATLTPTVNKPLANPVFLIDNYQAGSLPSSISVNGSSASSGYYASVDTFNQRLWITVNLSSITSASPLNLIVTEPPSPSSITFNPTNGTVGTPVTISGQNFSGTTPVDYTVTGITFSGGISATIGAVTSTSVQTTVPAGAISGPISVTTSGGTGTSAASFTPEYTLTESALPSAGGTVGPGSGTLAGGPQTLTATPNSGYEFTGWTANSNPGSTSLSTNITLNSNQTYVANFEQVFTITVNTNPPVAGTVTGSGTFVAGASQTVIAAVTNSIYAFSNWTVGATVGSKSPSTNFTLGSNVTLTANFALTPPQLVVLNGTSVVNTSQSFNFGSSQQNSTGSNITFTVTNSGGSILDYGIVSAKIPAGFIVTQNPNPLAYGASDTFSVQLNTTAVGNYSGVIYITNNGASKFIISVAGIVANPAVSISGNLAFGGVALGASNTQMITISNSGSFPLVVSNIICSPAVFSGACSGILQAGGSTNVPVTFLPTAASNYDGAVTVISDAPNGANTIAASGYGKNGTLVLAIDINGPGSVSPNLTGQTLALNSKHKITAIPTSASEDIFTGWTGSITTNKNPFTFTMEPSTVLEANFIPNPFPPFVGTYNGLFIETNGIVTEETAGMLKGLSVSLQGAYTGTLLINGTSHVIDGAFDPTSIQATNTFASKGSEGELTVVMTLVNPGNSAPQVTGTVSGSAGGVAWVANLMADLATNLPSAQYTMLILPDTNNTPPNLSPTAAPGGDGYALIDNRTDITTITGALADGAALDQKVAISQDGYVPIYASLYGGKGLLLGWINLDSTNATGVSLTWIHPVTHSGIYQKGFTNVLLANQILLSPWTDSPASLNILTNLASLSLLNTINDTTALNHYPVTTTAAGKVSGAHVSGSINRTNGLLTVTFPNGAVGHGAVLPNQTNAGGYLLTSPTAKAIQLAP